jgi:small subunit ribosomal protein S1
VINSNPTTDLDESNETAFTEEMSFEDMIDAYNYDEPYRGQILEGVVLESSEDEVLIDVGLKRDAIVTRKDLGFLDDKLKDRIVPGAELMTYVLQPRNSEGDLIVSINKALELEDWENARKAFDQDQVVEAEVVDTNRGGLLVRYGRLNGFIPQSHIVSLPRFASQEELHDAKRRMVGKILPLKFIEIDRRRNRLIMSERAARSQAEQTRLSELKEGMTVKGRVVSIVDFGAFVDLGGVDGLIHISKLAHSHVNHPGEVVAVGDEVEVLIDSIDEDKSRISLDRTALLPDPWDTVTDEYNVGDLVSGVVTNVVDFGVFVQLPNGLQGLVHVSRMTMFGSSNPHDLLREGDALLVRIVSIEPDRQRIGLSVDDVTVREQEAWMHARNNDGMDDEDAVKAAIEAELAATPEVTTMDDIVGATEEGDEAEAVADDEDIVPATAEDTVEEVPEEIDEVKETPVE